jgi:hypothetical protein
MDMSIIQQSENVKNTGLDEDKPKNVLYFKGSKYRPRIINYAGFDIETWDENKKFLCGSVVSRFGNFYFTKASEMRKEFFKRKYRGFKFVATNLGFDFFGLFFGTEYIMKFRFLLRQGSLINATCYNVDGRPEKEHIKGKLNCKIEFIDTLNYSGLSVEKMGKLLDFHKLDHPEFLGERPKTPQQWAQIKAYNIRDSEISLRFMEFFENICRMKLKVTPKITLASTSMKCFQNNYMGDSMYVPLSPDVQIDCQNAFYGGRCEVFSRGLFKEIYHYDINSMYPYCMMKFEYPDPNSIKTIDGSYPEYIHEYHGISLVTIECPHMKYPLLPFRTENKLLFPYGSFTSWQSHIELRMALKLGYKLIKIHKMHYFDKTCRPFADFVNTLYPLKCQAKKDNSPMEHIYKIFLNGTFGKFGEKWFNKEVLIPNDFTVQAMRDFVFKHDADIVDDFLLYKKTVRPKAHHIPIWALYVTAYARLVLYKYIVDEHALYCDTDCIMTPYQISTTDELGGMKLERYMDEVILMKPKGYGMKANKFLNIPANVKFKGLGKKAEYKDFQTILDSKPISYIKPAKFKEAIRNGLIPNQNIKVKKLFSLEDTKRFWKYPFNPNLTEESEPLFITMETSKMLEPKIILESLKNLYR